MRRQTWPIDLRSFAVGNKSVATSQDLFISQLNTVSFRRPGTKMDKIDLIVIVPGDWLKTKPAVNEHTVVLEL